MPAPGNCAGILLADRKWTLAVRNLRCAETLRMLSHLLVTEVK